MQQEDDGYRLKTKRKWRDEIGQNDSKHSNTQSLNYLTWLVWALIQCETIQQKKGKVITNYEIENGKY